MVLLKLLYSLSCKIIAFINFFEWSFFLLFGLAIILMSFFAVAMKNKVTVLRCLSSENGKTEVVFIRA